MTPQCILLPWLTPRSSWPLGSHPHYRRLHYSWRQRDPGPAILSPSRPPLHHSLPALCLGRQSPTLAERPAVSHTDAKSHPYAYARVVPTSCPAFPPFSVWKILTPPLRLSLNVASAEDSLTLPGRTGHYLLPLGSLPHNYGLFTIRAEHSWITQWGTVCLHGSVSPSTQPRPGPHFKLL